ncbi:galactonate dehydratase [Haloarcula onubensis]|uniref:Galactonate dehydratase n=1 Tax=Haloarcula onubensis TaxID=2950539 RepID=A0ABU2FKL6_9EURY|nr:galactonate dehydratase [Halomicroarcula sp. S3CR25-11]MDS0280746.1 galactonate dehydratase [Halomicroarcula sp. S3CR25-11]
MQITGYELFEVPPRWVFLKLETDAGIAGWGEPIIEGHARTTRAAVTEMLEKYLLGKDPLEIERHWQGMYRGRHFRGGPILMSAIGGIDQALWDIKGKHYGAPVYDLLGGRARDKVRVYQWVGGETPAAVADAAAEAVEGGYRTVKLAAVSQLRPLDTPAAVRQAADRVGAVREAVGDDVDVIVDLRGRVNSGMARRVAAELEPFDPMYFEEPVLSENVDRLPRLQGQTSVPLAMGERMYSRWEFNRAAVVDGVDVVQPSPSHAGGISEVQKIATAAEGRDVLVSLHCPLGPVSLASCLHLDITLPNAIVQAQNLNIHAPSENELLKYLSEPDAFSFDDGYATPPDRPGLGIDIDEAYLREKSGASIEWQNPTWYHDDGSIAEW